MRTISCVIAAIAFWALPVVGHATLTVPVSLQEAVNESTWILHVRVKRVETPFEKENDFIRIGLCELLEVIKSDDSGEEILIPVSAETVRDGDADPLNNQGKSVIATFFRRQDLSPIEEGGEYVFLCKKATMIVVAVGEGRVYKVTEGKVSAYLSDFPDHGESSAKIEAQSKQRNYDRIDITLPEFVKRIRELDKTEQGSGLKGLQP